MKDTKYKVTNTTVKPSKVDPKTGKDLRKMIEKVGHVVTFTDNTGRKHTLYQHKPVIISELNQGILNLRDGGFVKIEKVDDVLDVLKPHAMKRTAAASALEPKKENSPMSPLEFDGPYKDAETVEETPDFGEPRSNHGVNRRAHAAEMGAESKASDITESDAVNPDGPPNFAVTAKHNAAPRRKRQE